MIYYKVKFKYTVTEETDEAKLMRFWRKADSSYVGGQIFRVIILDCKSRSHSTTCTEF